MESFTSQTLLVLSCFVLGLLPLCRPGNLTYCEVSAGHTGEKQQTNAFPGISHNLSTMQTVVASDSSTKTEYLTHSSDATRQESKITRRIPERINGENTALKTTPNDQGVMQKEDSRHAARQPYITTEGTEFRQIKLNRIVPHHKYKSYLWFMSGNGERAPLKGKTGGGFLRDPKQSSTSIYTNQPMTLTTPSDPQSNLPLVSLLPSSSYYASLSSSFSSPISFKPSPSSPISPSSLLSSVPASLVSSHSIAASISSSSLLSSSSPLSSSPSVLPKLSSLYHKKAHSSTAFLFSYKPGKEQPEAQLSLRLTHDSPPKMPSRPRYYTSSQPPPNQQTQQTQANSAYHLSPSIRPNRRFFVDFRTLRNSTLLLNHKSKLEIPQRKRGYLQRIGDLLYNTTGKEANVPNIIERNQVRGIERRKLVKRNIIGSSWSPHGYADKEGDVFANRKKAPLEEGEDYHGKTTLYIGGLFELTGNKFRESGQSELDAAQLAISHVNELDIIPGYRLKLLYNDSKCDPGAGTDAFYDLLYRKAKQTTLTMVMGTSCNEVTKTLAEIVPYWNLILISYAADSPALSEREKYRTFFRLALGHSALNQPRRLLIQHFQWKKVAALYEDLEALSLAFNAISKDFAANEISVDAIASFKNPTLEVAEKLQEFKDKDVRIIIGGFSETTARHVFCEAFKRNMIGDRYVWILVGSLKRTWWVDKQDTSCTREELARAVEGIFTAFGLNGLLPGDTSVANLTYPQFLQEYDSNNGSQPVNMFAPSSYDTVWTMALTISRTLDTWNGSLSALKLHNINYTDMEQVKDAFIDTLEGLSFSGVTGPVSFSGSDRQGISVVYQIQGGNFTVVAIHQPSSTHLDLDCDLCSPIIWRDGKVPKDGQMVVLRMKVIMPSVFFTSLAFCVTGTAMAICFLWYNLHHRKLKFIKLSSPKLNNVAVIGCILVYVVVVMLGMDDTAFSDHYFAVTCSIRAFMLSSGFSLAFGAIFAKTFRVHRLFTRAHRGLVKSKLIQDSHLLVIIGVLLVFDSSLVCVWVIVDPMSRRVSNLTQKVSSDDQDLIYQDQLTTCHSIHLHKWLGAFYAYKGVLLLFGVYMAWETRHVKVPALNDSQYIGMNVYNVVIMAVCVVVISNVLYTQPTLAYAMEAAFMIMSTTITLCLLFVPKICAIVASKGNPIVASTGILVDRSNTRRFVFDDRKEIYYRAEVQNRVYKRELVEMDKKISRLERLLEIPLEPIPRLTEELLYLLPESNVDGTPECQRRFKQELERCCSISDGGEGVTYSASETDDMLSDVNVSLTRGSTAKWSSSVEISRDEDEVATSGDLHRSRSDDSLRPDKPNPQSGGTEEFKRKERQRGRKDRKVLPSDISLALVQAGFYEPAISLFKPKCADIKTKPKTSKSHHSDDIDFGDETEKKIGMSVDGVINFPTNNHSEENKKSKMVMAASMKEPFVSPVPEKAEKRGVGTNKKGGGTNREVKELLLPELSRINQKGNSDHNDSIGSSKEKSDLGLSSSTEMGYNVGIDPRNGDHNKNDNGYPYTSNIEIASLSRDSPFGHLRGLEAGFTTTKVNFGTEIPHSISDYNLFDRTSFDIVSSGIAPNLKENAIHSRRLRKFDMSRIFAGAVDFDESDDNENYEQKSDKESKLSRNLLLYDSNNISYIPVIKRRNGTDEDRSGTRGPDGASSRGRTRKNRNRKSNVRPSLFYTPPKHKQRKQKKQTQRQGQSRSSHTNYHALGGLVLPATAISTVESIETCPSYSHPLEANRHPYNESMHSNKRYRNQRHYQNAQQIQSEQNKPSLDQPLSFWFQSTTLSSPLQSSCSVPSNLTCLAFPTSTSTAPVKSQSSMNVPENTWLTGSRVSPVELSPHWFHSHQRAPHYPLVPTVTPLPQEGGTPPKAHNRNKSPFRLQPDNQSIASRPSTLEYRRERSTLSRDFCPSSSSSSSVSFSPCVNFFDDESKEAYRKISNLSHPHQIFTADFSTKFDSEPWYRQAKRPKPQGRGFIKNKNAFGNISSSKAADVCGHIQNDNLETQTFAHVSLSKQQSYLDTIPLSPRSARVKHFAEERQVRINKLKADLSRIQRELKNLNLIGEDKVSSV